MLRTNEMLPRDTYLRNTFSHRFCLVVRGDANGTPKLTEVLAAGGAVRAPPTPPLPPSSFPSQPHTLAPYPDQLRPGEDHD